MGGGVALNGKNDRVEELWNQYRERYAVNFVAKHTEVMDAASDAQILRDIVASELWSAFRGIAELPIVDRRLVVRADDIVRQIRSGGCTADVASRLAERAVCSCGNGLNDLSDVGGRPSMLRQTIEQAIEQFRTSVISQKAGLIAVATAGSNIDLIIEGLETNSGFPRLGASELRTLATAFSGLSGDSFAAPPVESEPELALLSF
jgi:hypothetical protein